MGIVIFSLSMLVLAFTISHRFTLRIEFLKSCLNFLKYLENEISYSKDTIYDILKRYPDNHTIQRFLRNCCENIEKENDFNKSWTLALDEVKEDFNLKKSDLNFLENLGNNLGKSDVDSQLSYCELALNACNLNLAESIEERNKKSKLYCNLCLLSGVTFILLIL